MSTTKRLYRWVGLFGLATLIAAPASGQELLRSYPGPVVLQPGDVVQLTFWREADLGGDFTIDENGSVVLPILGRWNVTGVPTDELKRHLTEAYAGQLRNQDVHILFLHRVSILGAVENPGLYHVDATMTLREAIALAGGVSDDGRTEEFKVRHAQDEEFAEIDPGAAVGATVWSGDEIVVPQRSWFSRNSVTLVGGVLSAAAIILSRAWF